MFKELIAKYSKRKKGVEMLTIQSVEDEKLFDINITRYDNLFKVEVSDYISIIDYVERMKEIDQFNLLDLICNGVLWNSKSQQVNKGTYYVVINDGFLYNVFVGENKIIIDERVKVGDHTEQRHIISHENGDYNYTHFKHDEIGSTYYTMYYSNKGFPIKAFELSKEDAYSGVQELLSNIELIPNMDSIIDVNRLRDKILEDLIPSSGVCLKK